MNKIAFIYPGQGAQKAGMGADFYEKSEKSSALYEKAGDMLDLDLKALCFEQSNFIKTLFFKGEHYGKKRALENFYEDR